MQPLSPLYDKNIDCPVCKATFVQKSVRSRHVRILIRDSDFCVHYDGVDPLLYGVFVCPTCGYAMSEKEFSSISAPQKDVVKTHITPKWKKQDYSTERTLSDALTIHKIAFYEAGLMNKPKTVQGMLSLKIAWIYRKQGSSEELRFLNNTVTLLEQAYAGDSFLDSSFSQEHCAYLVGELNRRLANYKEAIKWFDTALRKGVSPTPFLRKLIQEQWQETAMAAKALKNQQGENC